MAEINCANNFKTRMRASIYRKTELEQVGNSNDYGSDTSFVFKFFGKGRAKFYGKSEKT